MPSPPSPPNHPLLPPPDLFTRLTDPSSPLFFLALLALTAFGSLTARDFYLQLSFPLVVANLGSGFQAAGTILISIVGWQLWYAALQERSEARKAAREGTAGGETKKQAVGK